MSQNDERFPINLTAQEINHYLELLKKEPFGVVEETVSSLRAQVSAIANERRSRPAPDPHIVNNAKKHRAVEDKEEPEPETDQQASDES